MARIVHCHPSQTQYDFHIFTDLDFWDARLVLKDLAVVKRNFGQQPSGDEFPTQVVGKDLSRPARAEIERRIKRSVSSPPRHLIVKSVLMDGFFEFDPAHYYPARWNPSRMLHFTYLRLPLEQGGLNSPYRTVRLHWVDGKIRLERVQRDAKHDPPITSRKEALRKQHVPLCF